MAPRTLALALAVSLALVAPAASAFSSTTRELVIAYDLRATPVIIGAGEIGLSGSLSGGLLLGGTTTTSLQGIDTLRIATSSGPMEVRDAGLEVSRGALLWRFSTGALALDAEAPYALGLALPQAPIPSEDGLPSAGFLLAGENITGSASWASGTMELVPLDAIVTIRDARGQPIAEWNAREVNEDIQSAEGADGHEVAFSAEGSFTARIGAAIVAGATGRDASLSLRVSHAEEDRFAQTVALLGQTASSFSNDPPGFTGEQGPLAVLERVSGILNGALILVPGDGSSAEAIPREARWGADDFEIGAFNVVRGDDLGLAWEGGELRVQGEPSVALGRDGFAVEPPARLGIFPIVSVLLWALAIAGIVAWTIRRPPKGVHDRSTRLVSFAVYVPVFLLALWLWDRSFTQTFGTGALAVASQGVSAETLPQIATLAVIELIPWGIAGFLFALPVRIAAGIALRYLGRGKSYKGIATAAGLVSLAIFGPIYALWCFNLIWAQAGRMIAG